MSNELLYKKQWRLLQRRGIDIKNSAPLKSYIDKKVQILEKTHLKPEQKNEKIRYYQISLRCMNSIKKAMKFRYHLDIFQVKKKWMSFKKEIYFQKS